MNSDSELSFTRYLSAKKSLDDRSLNRRVWDGLAALLHERSATRSLRVLEIGAGIGTMVERCVEWGLFGALPDTVPPRQIEMTVIDDQPENIAEAHRRLPAWARSRGLTVDADESGYRFSGGDLNLTVRLAAVDLFDFADAQSGQPRWDLLIGQALLDTLDVPASLPLLFALLEPGGLFYFSITFDGATVFQPQADPALDDLIERLYHRSMDERLKDGRQLGESRAGRHLFHHVTNVGGRVLDMGSSDWVVFPHGHGYTADEVYFLRFILQFVADALTGHPDMNQQQLTAWLTTRQQQIERGELVFIAHQLDLLGATPD